MIWLPEVLSHPNIPKPLHGINPRSLFGQAWWDNIRKKAYAASNYHCCACKVHKSQAKKHQWLEAHENYKIDYEKGEVKIINIVPLCHYCHNFIHSGRLQKLYQASKISDGVFIGILQHGCNILSQNNLKGFPPTIELAEYVRCKNIPDSYEMPKTTVPWDKWHLKIGTKKYYSKFKNKQEWADFYSR